MLTFKRVFIATVCGIVFGFVCLGLATSGSDSPPMALAIKGNIVLSRSLMGFMIGVSALRLCWWLHGIILGLVSSLPMALGVLATTTQPAGGMSPAAIAIYSVVMGLIYGFLTELITTGLFRAKSTGKA